LGKWVAQRQQSFEDTCTAGNKSKRPIGRTGDDKDEHTCWDKVMARVILIEGKGSMLSGFKGVLKGVKVQGKVLTGIKDDREKKRKSDGNEKQHLVEASRDEKERRESMAAPCLQNLLSVRALAGQVKRLQKVLLGQLVVRERRFDPNLEK
jgi:hypothetical protein